MTTRRAFLRSALIATASGLLVPEWILDPPKGRSMVTVPTFSEWFIGYGSPEYIKVDFGDGRVEMWVPEVWNSLALAS